MSRTTLRSDDLRTVADAQRPLNETLRELMLRLDSMPRREQTWLRFTCLPGGGVVGVTIKGPDYSVAAAVVLAVQSPGLAGNPFTAAPFLALEPVEGDVSTYRVQAAYGLPVTGTFDVLVEFVENVAAAWPRTDVTGGVS